MTYNKLEVVDRTPKQVPAALPSLGIKTTPFREEIPLDLLIMDGLALIIRLGV